MHKPLTALYAINEPAKPVERDRKAGGKLSNMPRINGERRKCGRGKPGRGDKIRKRLDLVS